MKNIIFAFIAVILAVSTGVGNNIEQKNENTGDVSMVTQNDINANSSIPKYQTIRFDNVSDLIEWIKNGEIENFQEGRYKNGISLLREHGKILYVTL